MNRFIRIIALLTAFTLCCCSDETKNEPAASQVEFVSGKEIPKEELERGQKSLTTLDETSVVKFHGTEGTVYQFEVRGNSRDFGLDLSAKSSDGYYTYQNTIKYSDFKQFATLLTFEAEWTGEYIVTITLSEISDGISGPFDFTYTIVEVPLPAELEGEWFLVQEKSFLLGELLEKNYSKDSAKEVIEIRNNDLISYTTGDGSLTRRVYCDSDQGKMKYELREDTLFYNIGTSDGWFRYVYTRYRGDFSDLLWIEDHFVVPDELIGTWYWAGGNLKVLTCKDSAVTEREYDTSLTSQETSRVVKIRKDSIITYWCNWGVDSSVVAVKDDWFIWNYREASGEIVEENSNVWFRLDGWSVHQTNDIYKPYSGALPAAWSDITIPAVTTPLQVEQEFTSEVEPGDTLWFSLSLEENQEYYFRSSDEYSVSFALFDSNKEKVKTFEYWFTQSYITGMAGTYYLGAHVSGSYRENPRFDITVSKSYSRSSSNSSEKHVPVPQRSVWNPQFLFEY